MEHYDAKGTIKKEVFKSQEKSNLFSNMKPETFTFNSTTANHSEASLEETISARILAIGGNLTQETKLQVGHHVPNKTVTLVSTNNSVYGSTYKINSVNYFYNGGTSNAGSTGNVKGGRASVYGIPGRATNIRVSMKVISYGGAHDKEYVFTDDKLYMCIIDDNVSYSDTGC